MYELGFIVLTGCAVAAVHGAVAIIRLIVVTRANLAVERERGRNLLALAAAGVPVADKVHHGLDHRPDCHGTHR